MLPSQKVAFHADDFGLCESLDEGIVESFSGVVRSVSVVAGGRSFQKSYRLLEGTRASVGIHLTLDEEEPVTPAQSVASLVTCSGFFYKRSDLLRRLSFSNSVNLSEIEVEFRNQIQLVFDAGLKPTHIDGHGHIHIHPRVAPITAALAKEFRIGVVRQPCEPMRYRTGIGNSRRVINKIVVSAMAKMSASEFKGSEFTAPPVFYGISHGGRLGIKEISNILLSHRHASPLEIMCHPGFCSQEALDRYGHWHYDWQSELQSLTSPDVASLLSALDYELCSVEELTRD